MIQIHECTRCGREYVGAYCICEYMEDEELDAYIRHDIFPERLKQYSREEIDADFASTSNWQSWYD